MTKYTVNECLDQARNGDALPQSYNSQHSNPGYISDTEVGATPNSSDAISNGDNSNQQVQQKANPDDEDQGGSCGWGSFQPQCCQRMRTIQMFLVVLTMSGAVSGMAINGFVNTVISTLERRFELSSTESGLIASCYDIMFVILVVPITYFGGQGNKPRYIGVGMFILGLGSFVFALPHFMTGTYSVGEADENVCEAGGNVTDTCGETTLGSSLSNYKYMFYAGQLLNGAGTIALLTLGITYIDENVPQRLSSFYNAIFYTGDLIGPAVGYMLGAGLLDIYTDTGVEPASLGLDSNNPRWVGAWWIGFLASGTFCLLLSIPLFGFPKELPGYHAYKSERGQETQAQKQSDTTGQSKGFRDMFLSLKLLLTNWPFVFLCLAAAASSLLVSGFSTFLPKYLEYQFGMSASTAAFYVGLIIVPFGGGATFAGGYIVKFFDLRIKGILRLCAGASVLLILCSFGMLIKCDSPPFAGVSLPYDEKYEAGRNYEMTKNLDAACNAGCGCVEDDYHPMCGADGVLYFSPCYAGCAYVIPPDETEDNPSRRYGNCSCVGLNESIPELSQGTFGKCDNPCDSLATFMVLLSLQIIFIFISAMPALTATLRCVPDNQRSFCLGVQWTVAKSLGSIPGPILFGKMFDLVCLVWQKRCDGDGTCYSYDNINLGINLLILAVVFSAAIAASFVAAHYFYKAAPKSGSLEVVVDDPPAQMNLRMESFQNVVST